MVDEPVPGPDHDPVVVAGGVGAGPVEGGDPRGELRIAGPRLEGEDLVHRPGRDHEVAQRLAVTL